MGMFVSLRGGSCGFVPLIFSPAGAFTINSSLAGSMTGMVNGASMNWPPM